MFTSPEIALLTIPQIPSPVKLKTCLQRPRRSFYNINHSLEKIRELLGKVVGNELAEAINPPDVWRINVCFWLWRDSLRKELMKKPKL
jgi:hypothetical protein